MTVEEIREKLKTSEYDFLRNNKHLGSNIILLGLGGSYSYGMNIEGKSEALLFRFTGSAGLFSTLFIYFGSLNELFSETILLNTGYSAVESFASMQKYPFLTNWKLS